MSAYGRRGNRARPRERAVALAAVLIIQLGLGVLLVRGFEVDVVQTRDVVERLINIRLTKPPPPRLPPKAQPRRRSRSTAAAAAATPKAGAPRVRKVARPLSPPTPIIAVHPAAAPSGGGKGSGPASGGGIGGGSGGNGSGDGDGGTDLEQIAGTITSGDYPRALREAGLGGRVSFLFTVEPSGRVGACHVTASSGVPELDRLTCSLVQQRFRYRPSTNAFGRPISDEVEGQQEWIARSR